MAARSRGYPGVAGAEAATAAFTSLSTAEEPSGLRESNPGM
ncbi:hypothetical protein [Halarchaeum grantii]|nr:hypothetical protein [Halarchaeum grantii]